MIKLIAHRNLNFHSRSTEGGLVHAPAKRPVRVPDDVREHPMFRHLVKKGVVSILGGDDAKKFATQKVNVPNIEDVKDEDREDDEVGSKEPANSSLIPEAEVLSEHDEDALESLSEEDEDDEEDAQKPGAAKPEDKK